MVWFSLNQIQKREVRIFFHFALFTESVYTIKNSISLSFCCRHITISFQVLSYLQNANCERKASKIIGCIEESDLQTRRKALRARYMGSWNSTSFYPGFKLRYFIDPGQQVPKEKPLISIGNIAFCSSLCRIQTKLYDPLKNMFLVGTTWIMAAFKYYPAPLLKTGSASTASSTSDSDNTKLWHMRLGHMSERGMAILKSIVWPKYWQVGIWWALRVRQAKEAQFKHGCS